MSAEIRVEEQQRHARSVDANGIPSDRPVPSDDIVVLVGDKIVSITMRKRLGMQDQDSASGTRMSKEPATRWGLPEDPPGGARLLG